MIQAAPTTVLQRRLYWAAMALTGAAWIAVLFAAAMGEPAPWPGWLLMVTNTGMVAGSALVRGHPKGIAVLMVVVMTLSVVAIIGMAVK